MTRRLWYLIAFLAVLTFCQSAEAQTWRNDALGRPAPPCFLLSADGSTTVPCSAANPIPTSGASAGLGTTTGTSTTGFGKQWFPSTLTGTVVTGQQMVAFFDGSDLNVVFLRRSTTCGSCLQVAVSTDGGVTGTFFSTSTGLGNSIQTAFRVPSNPVRYLVSNIGGPLNIFQSPSLASGWTTITGLTNPILSWASKPDGSRVLSSDTAGNICISTDNGISFGSCTNPGGATTLSSLAYAGGTVWLLHEGIGGNLRRSTNDGVSFALVTSFGTNAQALRCLSPSYTVCTVKNSDGNVRVSTDAGLTWTTQLTGLGATGANLCEAQANNPTGSGVFSLIQATPPIGFAAIAQNAFSSFNAGTNWFPGQTNGSHWDGTGAPSLSSMDCRNGRGIATYSTTGGGTNVFAVYNPLTQPGGVLQSSAGGYSIAAPIQAGIILNAAPTVSAANTAAVVTLTNTAGSRVCVRSITLFSSAAGAATLTVTDGATAVRNFGTLVTGTSAVTTIFEGTPLLCGQTSNNVVINVGAAGAGVTTTTSVIADRYPN